MIQCKDCKWWDELSPKKTSGDEKCGQCHRIAPSPKYLFSAFEPRPDTEEIEAYSVKWPFTEFNDWCGDFTSK